MKRFKVVSIHFTNKCNLNCPFCYKERGNNIMMHDMFLYLPKYLSKITPQVAVGGGEPLLFPELLKTFARNCRKHSLICNVTSNGREIDNMSDDELRDLFKYIRMISLSIDEFKVNSEEDFEKYINRVKRLKKVGVEVGANLLVNKKMFEDFWLIKIVDVLFKIGVDRVFALYPKNFELGVDIKEFEDWYAVLTTRYEHFYVDDLHNKILTEGYDFKSPCHYGNDIINIDLDGSVYGCSFNKEPIGRIEEAEDILQFAKLKESHRMKCPFLIRGEKIEKIQS